MTFILYIFEMFFLFIIKFPLALHSYLHRILFFDSLIPFLLTLLFVAWIQLSLLVLLVGNNLMPATQQSVAYMLTLIGWECQLLTSACSSIGKWLRLYKSFWLAYIIGSRKKIQYRGTPLPDNDFKYVSRSSFFVFNDISHQGYKCSGVAQGQFMVGCWKYASKCLILY